MVNIIFIIIILHMQQLEVLKIQHMVLHVLQMRARHVTAADDNRAEINFVMMVF